MLLLTSAALPQLHQHAHPNLGRLITPSHFPRLADTLAAGFLVAADNEALRGYRPDRVAQMVTAIAPLPSVAARINRAWTPTSGSFTGLGCDLSLPAVHPRFLWLAVPDVIHRQDDGALIGDADATLERFREWHMWLSHLPLAFVLQDGVERPGRVPWDAPGLAAVFVGGSTEWKLGRHAADLVREARRRNLYAHMGRVSTARRIRYAGSIGCTSFDSSRYSIWRRTLLDDGVARAAQPPQQRLVP